MVRRGKEGARGYFQVPIVAEVREVYRAIRPYEGRERVMRSTSKQQQAPLGF